MLEQRLLGSHSPKTLTTPCQVKVDILPGQTYILRIYVYFSNCFRGSDFVSKSATNFCTTSAVTGPSGPSKNPPSSGMLTSISFGGKGEPAGGRDIIFRSCSGM